MLLRQRSPLSPPAPPKQKQLVLAQQQQQQQPEASPDLTAVVESLGDLAPPWLKIAALGEQAKGESFAPAPGPGSGSAFPPLGGPHTPRALPYPAPSPEAWLAADPCHAEPNPCAAVAPFTYEDVKSARSAKGRFGANRGRLPAPAHLAPLTPTAPWSSVSGPGGSGPNPYWVTGQAATSIPGLSPTFGPQQPAESMVLIAAAEAPLGKDTGRGAASAAAAAASSTTSARRSLLLAATPSAPAASPPRASWAGALTKSSPRLSSSSSPSSDGGGRASFSATPFVVDTDGDGYRFQVSSAGNWVPSLALYRGEFVAGASEEKNDQIATAAGPLSSENSGSPNSAALTVETALKRGELYTLVISPVAGASAEADDESAEADAEAGDGGSGGGARAAAAAAAAAPQVAAAAVGDWVALASGPGGVYPDRTSIPPRWTVSASTAAAAAAQSSSSSLPAVLKRPAAAAVGVSGSAEGEDSAADGAVPVATIPFVAAASGKGFEWRVTAPSSSSSSPSWSLWAAVYELGPSKTAASSSAAPAGLGKEVAAAAAPEGSSSVSLKDLALEGGGKPYVLVVGGKNAKDAAAAGGAFTAEVFGPQAVKGYVLSPTVVGDLGNSTTTPISTTPPPTTTPAVVPSGAPASAPAPSPSTPTPTPTSTQFVDPPPPPPVPFVQYGISVRGSWI